MHHSRVPSGDTLGYDAGCREIWTAAPPSIGALNCLRYPYRKSYPVFHGTTP